MKKIVIFILVGMSINSYAQNRRYYANLATTKAFFIEEGIATENKLDVIHFDAHNYAGMVLNNLNATRAKRGRKDLVQDSTFNRMCKLGVNHFSKSFFTSRKHRNKVVRYTDFSLRKMKGEHRLFRAIVFTQNVVHLSDRNNFYLDRRDKTTDLQLFEGEKSTAKPEDEDYIEPVPVKELTEKQFVWEVIKSIKRENGARELITRNYTHVGVSIRIDPTSINKKRVPRVFVMVLLGGKQTQKVKIRDPYPVKTEG